MAATLNFMSSDRSAVQYAAKAVCTKMANPTRGSWQSCEEGRQVFERGAESDVVDGVVERNDDEVNVDVHVDSDWASGP